MATLTFIEKKCYVCGTIGRFGEGGLLLFSPPVGLDGHPGNLTPLFTAIHICPHCYFASPDISDGNEQIKAIVQEEKYRGVAGNPKIHELIRKYIAWALIQNRIGNDTEAARTMLFATWLSEQYEHPEITSQCRIKTIHLMNRCTESGGSFEITRGREALTLADLYRREQKFAEAESICSTAFRTLTLSEDDEFLLRYEEKLIKLKNYSPASITEAERNL